MKTNLYGHSSVQQILHGGTQQFTSQTQQFTGGTQQFTTETQQITESNKNTTTLLLFKSDNALISPLTTNEFVHRFLVKTKRLQNTIITSVGIKSSRL